MSTHKVLFLLEKHGKLAVGDAPTPQPGPGELLVEVRAAGLNPGDWKVHEYGLFITEYPAILGVDGAGIVKEVGEGVTNFVVGDRILWEGWTVNTKTTFQQYSIVPSDLTAKLPPNLTFEQGATIPGALVTAVFSFYGSSAPTGELRGAGLTPFWESDGRGKYSGQAILIVGGSSAVGQQAIQVAKLSGFSPIIATASTRNFDFVKSLGATHVIDRSAPLASSVKAITSEPIKYVYDAISTKETQEPAYEVLAPEGTFIVVLGFAVDKAKIDESKAIVHPSGFSQDPTQKELGVTLFKHVASLLENGEIKPNNVDILPNGLSGIPDGLEKLKANKVSASKLVAQPWA